MCGFVQDSNDNFDWSKRQGSTPSTGTGPSADHTSGNGMKRLSGLHLLPLLLLKIESDVKYCYDGILYPKERIQCVEVI